MLGNTLSDANNQRNLSGNGIKDGIGGERRGNVYNSGIGLNTISSLLHSVKHRQAKVQGATLLRSNTTNNLSSVGNGLLRVESSLLSSEALADHSGVLVDPNIGVLRERTLGGGGHHTTANIRKHFS